MCDGEVCVAQWDVVIGAWEAWRREGVRGARCAWRGCGLGEEGGRGARRVAVAMGWVCACVARRCVARRGGWCAEEVRVGLVIPPAPPLLSSLHAISLRVDSASFRSDPPL